MYDIWINPNANPNPHHAFTRKEQKHQPIKNKVEKSQEQLTVDNLPNQNSSLEEGKTNKNAKEDSQQTQSAEQKKESSQAEEENNNENRDVSTGKHNISSSVSNNN